MSQESIPHTITQPPPACWHKAALVHNSRAVHAKFWPHHLHVAGEIKFHHVSDAAQVTQAQVTHHSNYCLVYEQDKQ